MKINHFLLKIALGLIFSTTLYAVIPVWTLTPLTATTVSVATGSTATVQYTVTNQSSRSHTLVMQPIRGVTQVTGAAGSCGTIFVLPAKGSCTLSLLVIGSQISAPINDGPIVCQLGGDQCYRPSQNNILHITSSSAPPTPSFFIGQSYGGGIVACLGGGLNNLIATTLDAPSDLPWGQLLTGYAGANSQTDGAGNTALILLLGYTPPYAAQYCSDYEVDSQGNSPCVTGTCYNDWFLPALDQLNCLYTNQSAIGGFDPTGLYWSSTESSVQIAWFQIFSTGTQNVNAKPATLHVRCVRPLS